MGGEVSASWPDAGSNKSKQTTELPAYKWSDELNKWSAMTVSKRLHVLPQGIETLTIVTWNVWFDQFMFARRCQEIIDILLHLDADFICIQEATAAFVTGLCAQDFVRKNYYVSDVEGKTFSRYGVMMLSKFEVSKFCKFDFEVSVMERSLLATPFLLPRKNSTDSKDEVFVVSTSHLESLDQFAKARISQIDETMQILASSPHAIFCGDCNCSAEAKENSHFTEEFSDTWKLINSDDPGYTMPKTDMFPPWRPDRIYLKSLSQRISCQDIIKIGTDPIDYPELDPSTVAVQTPSDHNGLFAKLTLK
jgi:tyrosyl-DNA phosphodiesterase 2